VQIFFYLVLLVLFWLACTMYTTEMDVVVSAL